MAGGLKDSPSRRRGGLELLRQVYDELYNQLGEDFSPAELLRAAQTLIDVTKEEYGAKSYQDGQLHPGYYSYDVDSMITNQQWLLLGVEAMSLDAREDMATSLRERSQSLKRLYNPDAYYHRG
ncbi:MAG: hypothetical protein EON58_09340 [Alphaproteobacteria bacterium]|nr:MAG: hypothetical protein EON58_09340 [Alphaproteobacteria bacterium]